MLLLVLVFSLFLSLFFDFSLWMKPLPLEDSDQTLINALLLDYLGFWKVWLLSSWSKGFIQKKNSEFFPPSLFCAQLPFNQFHLLSFIFSMTHDICLL
jgi:hypothetical protein